MRACATRRLAQRASSTDLLVDLVEAVVSPLLDEGLSDAEVTTLLPLYVTCFDAKFYDKDPGVHDQVEDITPVWNARAHPPFSRFRVRS